MSDEMGILRTDIEIESPLREGDRRLLRDVLVDTDAELSWAPAAVLESLGIARRKTVRFQQADGTVLERWVGFAIVHAGGTFTNDEVVFGEAGDLILLGARSLEGLNLKVDLVGKRLVSAGPMLAAAGLALLVPRGRASSSCQLIGGERVSAVVLPLRARATGVGRDQASCNQRRNHPPCSRASAA
jgi:predicted aspartyl protease